MKSDAEQTTQREFEREAISHRDVLLALIRETDPGHLNVLAWARVRRAMESEILAEQRYRAREKERAGRNEHEGSDRHL
jgi:hypothetical protein